MKTVQIIVALIGSILLSQAAHAGECVMTVTRTACPGKESESYSKCAGKQSCPVTKQADSADGCAKQAVEACQNQRTEITKYKKVTATYAGAAIKGGKDICASKAEGYDPDQAYPHRQQADCK